MTYGAFCHSQWHIINRKGVFQCCPYFQTLSNTAWSDLLHIKRCFWIKIKQNCNILTQARFFIMINKINISKARCRHDNSTEMMEKGWKSGSRLNYAVKKTETYGQQMRWRACGTGWVGSSHQPTFGRLQHRYPAWHRWPRCYRTWPLGFR